MERRSQGKIYFPSGENSPDRGASIPVKTSTLNKMQQDNATG
jgi:hypothetical protein